MSDELKEVETVALNLLARREHSRQELRQKLLLRKFSSEYIDAVLARLSEKNYQSDARFCENYTAMRSRQGHGPIRLQQELEQRGVSSEVIDQYVNENIDWSAIAGAVRQKKFGSALPRDFASRAKQISFLKYRGFTPEQIQIAIENHYEDE